MPTIPADTEVPLLAQILAAIESGGGTTPTNYTKADAAARLAGTYNVGDTVTQTDTGHVYLLIAADATLAASWQDLGYKQAANPVSFQLYDTGSSSLKTITLVNGILIIT